MHLLSQGTGTNQIQTVGGFPLVTHKHEEKQRGKSLEKTNQWVRRSSSRARTMVEISPVCWHQYGLDVEVFANCPLKNN
jgi:hypothetical protein